MTVGLATSSPVPAMIQKQQKSWAHYISELSEIVEKEDQFALRAGDLLSDIEAEFGKKHVWSAAEDTGLTRQMAKHRLRVSKRFPPGHWIREKRLTWTHLRHLSSITNESDLTTWSEKCVGEQWSAGRLLEEMATLGDQKAQQDGDPCIQCEESLSETDILVSFTVGGKRARCCGVRCAANYFTELCEDEDAEESANGFPLN